MTTIVIFFLFILYSLTLSNTIYGGDAGDLLSAVLTHGFAHPPGYPLYTSLGILFTKLPLFFLTPAGKVTIISLLSTVLSLFLLQLLIKELSPKKFYNPLLAGLVLLLIGTNYIVWLYSIVPEVFPLNTLFILSVFYLSVRYTKLQNNKYLYGIAFVTGLAVAHHHTLVFVLPSVMYLLIPRLKIKSKLTYVWTIVYFLLGLSPLLYLFYTYSSHSVYTWGMINNWSNFINLILRKDYGTFISAPIILSSSQSRLSQIVNLLIFFKGDFTMLGIILLLLSFVFYVKIKDLIFRKFMNAVYINMFLYGPFFVFYANFPMISNYLLATAERFLHIFYFFSAISLYFGFVYFLDFILTPLLKKLIHNGQLIRLTTVISAVLLIVYPYTILRKNIQTITSLKNDRTAENLSTDIIELTEKNSIILLWSDIALFNTTYSYFANPQTQQQRLVVNTVLLPREFYRDNLKRINNRVFIPNTNNEYKLISGIIEKNLKKFHIYSETPYKLTLKDYVWIPYGVVYKLVPISQNTESYISTSESFWKRSKNRTLPEVRKHPKFDNLFTSELLNKYATGHQNAADFYLWIEQPQLALQHIRLAKKLVRDDSALEQINQILEIAYFRVQKNCVQAEELAKRADINIKLINELYRIKNECYTEKKDKDRINGMIKKIDELRGDSFHKL